MIYVLLLGLLMFIRFTERGTAVFYDLCVIVSLVDGINQLSDNHRNKMSSLLTQYSFQQLITEPTYMTEHSSSLLDLVMVNNPTSALYTEVGPPC